MYKTYVEGLYESSRLHNKHASLALWQGCLNGKYDEKCRILLAPIMSQRFVQF